MPRSQASAPVVTHAAKLRSRSEGAERVRAAPGAVATQFHKAANIPAAGSTRACFGLRGGVGREGWLGTCPCLAAWLSGPRGRGSSRRESRRRRTGCFQMSSKLSAGVARGQIRLMACAALSHDIPVLRVERTVSSWVNLPS